MTPAVPARTAARRAQITELTSCPGHETLQILSRKWLTLIVEALAGGPLGHAAIARRVPGATQKMLTQTLRQMERDGLLTRTVTPVVPPAVDYELTDLGRSLLQLQLEVLRWGRANVDRVLAARAAYDGGVRVSDPDPDLDPDLTAGAPGAAPPAAPPLRPRMVAAR
jgi:DNA-binding HxlR family transcriptional regulator